MAKKGKPVNSVEYINEKINKFKKLSKLKKLIIIAIAILFSAFFINEAFNLGILPSLKEIERAVGLETVKQLPYDTQVHIIDVGQGDCILLQQGNTYALIDAGERSQGEVVLEYLERQGISRLEYVIISHMHTDHMGGMQIIIENMEIGTVILPDMTLVPTPTATSVISLLKAIQKKECQVLAATAGEVYQIGNGKITIVTAGIKSDNQNNNSVGILFEANGLSFLTTGDGEKEYEENLLQNSNLQQVDIFNAGHHGSYTSNTPELLYVIMPKFVVVSCGDNNDYGHPHREPMQLFYEIGATVLRTDQKGNIIFVVDENNNILVFTERQ